MRNIPRILSVTARVLFVAIALGAASVLVVPRLLGWETVTVLSGSMAPSYPTESVLAIDSVAPAAIRAGDVIAFRTEADAPMVTHRVVSVQRKGTGLEFVTKGDANEDPDRDPVSASALRGRVVFGVPYLGRFVRAVQTPQGFAVLLLLPALALIATQASTIRRDLRAKRNPAVEGGLHPATSDGSG